MLNLFAGDALRLPGRIDVHLYIVLTSKFCEIPLDIDVMDDYNIISGKSFL